MADVEVLYTHKRQGGRRKMRRKKEKEKKEN